MTLYEFFKTHDWTKNVLARDIHHNPVLPDDESAVCWCISGAMQRLGYFNSDIGDEKRYRIRVAYGANHTMPIINDTLEDKNALLDLLRKAGV